MSPAGDHARHAVRQLGGCWKLQIAFDSGENGADIRADRGERTRRDGEDQRQKDRIFDHGRAIFITTEVPQESKHADILPPGVRQPHRHVTTGQQRNVKYKMLPRQ